MAQRLSRLGRGEYAANPALAATFRGQQRDPAHSKGCTSLDGCRTKKESWMQKQLRPARDSVRGLKGIVPYRTPGSQAGMDDGGPTFEAVVMIMVK